MTTPTEAEIRNGTGDRQRDAWVAELVMGWRYDGYCTSRAVFITPNGKRECPDFSSDPAASAELERWLWATGECVITETDTGHESCTPYGVCLVRLIGTEGKEVRHDEPIADDPVAARMVALTKCAVLWKIGGGT